DGKALVTVSFDQHVRAWDQASGRQLRHFRCPGMNAALSPGGKLVAAGRYAPGIGLWETASGERLAELPGHKYACCALAFSHDGKRLVTGGDDRTVRLWDMTTRKQERSLGGCGSEVFAVAFAPDGRLVAGAGGSLGHDLARGGRPDELDFGVHLWDAATGKHLFRMGGDRSTVWALAFSPDGGLLASGGGDRVIRLWDVATGRLLLALEGHRGPVRGVSFAPDGSVLASVGDDGTWRLWDVATGHDFV